MRGGGTAYFDNDAEDGGHRDEDAGAEEEEEEYFAFGGELGADELLEGMVSNSVQLRLEITYGYWDHDYAQVSDQIDREHCDVERRILWCATFYLKSTFQVQNCNAEPLTIRIRTNLPILTKRPASCDEQECI